jgi:hypothetical protein
MWGVVDFLVGIGRGTACGPHHGELLFDLRLDRMLVLITHSLSRESIVEKIILVVTGMDYWDRHFPTSSDILNYHNEPNYRTRAQQNR